MSEKFKLETCFKGLPHFFFFISQISGEIYPNVGGIYKEANLFLWGGGGGGIE